MARYLSSQQIEQFRECFDVYDKKHGNKIKGRDLIICMRSLGMAPTQEEVKTYLRENEKRVSDSLDFDTFLQIIHKHLNRENPVKEIQKAFKLTDSTNRGFIGAKELRRILCNTGERLSKREVEQMFRAFNIQPNGYVRYDDFVRMITTPLPEI